MIYVFQSIPRIVSGIGALQSIGQEVQRLGVLRVLVVVSAGLVQRQGHLPLWTALKNKALRPSLFVYKSKEPTPEDVIHCAEAVHSTQSQLIIGLGGGSVLDCVKATAVLAQHSGPIERFFGVDLIPGPCLPTILIPTTAGTGSEVTSIAVLEDNKTNSKKAIASRYLYAKVALLDAQLTTSMPPQITANTGLDALIHAMESYVNNTASPITDGLNLQAMRLIADHLELAYAQGDDLVARSAMLHASALAGMGFSNTQNGIIHALAMAVPTHYHLPHGLLVAVIAPIGITFNAPAAPKKYAQIAKILGCQGSDTLELATKASQGMKNFLTRLNIQPGLASYGIIPQDLPGIAQRAAASKRLMDNNPRQATAQELEELLIEHF